VSATLRAILDDNDEPDGNEGKPLLGLRKIDPLPTPQAEERFLAMATDEFWKGLSHLILIASSMAVGNRARSPSSNLFQQSSSQWHIQVLSRWISYRKCNLIL
jgi:hypothetical protein